MFTIEEVEASILQCNGYVSIHPNIQFRIVNYIIFNE